MSYLSMASKTRAQVPKLPMKAAQDFVQKAWKDVRESGMWSFQLYEGSWIAPAQIQTGTAHVTQGSNQVVFDVTAGTAIDAGSTVYSLISQRQFRVSSGTIYNIWAWDSASRTATLDRMWSEATATATAYTIYQVYFAPSMAGIGGNVPVTDHLGFLSVRNMVNFIDLCLDKSCAQLDAIDPQRTWYYFPTDCVPYQVDQNSASVTYRCPLYELWGAPTYVLAYQLYGIRRGLDFSAPGDELPPAVGEDCVEERAKYYAYEWGEANKGENKRDQGPDFRFLMKAADARYDKLMKKYRMRDREYVNNWFSIRRSSLYSKIFPYYSSISGTANPGRAF